MSRRRAPTAPNFGRKGARKGGGGGATRAGGPSTPRGAGGRFWSHLVALLIGAALVAWLDRTVLRSSPVPPASGGSGAGTPEAVAAVAAPREPSLLSPPPLPRMAPAGKRNPPPLPDPRASRPIGARPRLAIVMDDAGERLEPIRELAGLDAPITLAVIPYLPASREAAELWHARGRDVILHLPMEALGGPAHDAGRGALRAGMDERDLRATVAEDLGAVPHIVGVNNHMGSRATSDGRLMDLFMAALKPSGLWFLDSRTAGSSIAYETARRHGVRSTYRSALFLDDERSEPAIRAALFSALAQARARGGAVTIGHVTSPETIRVLREQLPALRKECDLVPAASFLE